MNLKDSKTYENLKAAFAWESQANRRYAFFAAHADAEGQSDIAMLFRAAAQGETEHALGHLEYLGQCGDPQTGLPIGRTPENLQAAIAGEMRDAAETYPRMACEARAEGFAEIGEWFELLARAERSHARHFKDALDRLLAE